MDDRANDIAEQMKNFQINWAGVDGIINMKYIT